VSRSTIRVRLTVNDGTGNETYLGYPGPTGPPVQRLDLQGIQTGTWVSKWVNIDEHRRVSITWGVGSSTGAAADVGGFTGTLLVQGTDELAQCFGGTGTPDAGTGSRPGVNGWTGARFPCTIPSGSVPVTLASNPMMLSFTDVGAAFIRVLFNATGYGFPTATGTLGGSGTAYVYLTAKNM
jgi:hypothetical protein